MSKVKKTNPHCPVAGCKTTAPLSFAKTLAGCEINNIAAAVSRQLSVITPGHVSNHPPVPRNAGSLLSRATESAPRESCITPTTCRVEAAASKPVPEPIRQTVLGRRQSLLVRLETSSCRRHA
jgi:hypothetical protein